MDSKRSKLKPQGYGAGIPMYFKNRKDSTGRFTTIDSSGHREAIQVGGRGKGTSHIFRIFQQHY